MNKEEMLNRICQPHEKLTETDYYNIICESIQSSNDKFTLKDGSLINLVILMEEISELIQELTKDEVDYTSLCEEIADVFIMLQYPSILFGAPMVYNNSIFESNRDEKITAIQAIHELSKFQQTMSKIVRYPDSSDFTDSQFLTTTISNLVLVMVKLACTYKLSGEIISLMEDAKMLRIKERTDKINKN